MTRNRSVDQPETASQQETGDGRGRCDCDMHRPARAAGLTPSQQEPRDPFEIVRIALEWDDNSNPRHEPEALAALSQAERERDKAEKRADTMKAWADDFKRERDEARRHMQRMAKNQGWYDADDEAFQTPVERLEARLSQAERERDALSIGNVREQQQLRAENTRLREALERAEARARDVDGGMSACRMCESIAPETTAQSHKASCPFAVLSTQEEDGEETT